ncbi:MAG: response regulator [Anaerolineae bacterium]|nr:response regulator [Anaerolineae bacterium]MDQ7037313.1 response regulator [Anaerolineae bacterium]
MPIHALVIDDDSFNLEVLGRLLASEGATYTTVQDPTHIAATLDNINQVDVVFLDLEMPKIDGYKAFELLRSKLGASVPIIACTVHTAEIENAREQGFTGFLAKPLDRDRFTEQFSRIKNNQPVWDAS